MCLKTFGRRPFGSGQVSVWLKFCRNVSENTQTQSCVLSIHIDISGKWLIVAVISLMVEHCFLYCSSPSVPEGLRSMAIRKYTSILRVIEVCPYVPKMPSMLCIVDNPLLSLLQLHRDGGFVRQNCVCATYETSFYRIRWETRQRIRSLTEVGREYKSAVAYLDDVH